MRPDTPPKMIRLSDYRPPAFLIETVFLDVALGSKRTTVFSRLTMRRRPGAATDAPLVLDGEGIELLALRLDGAPLAEDRYEVGEKTLTIE
ncbi:MAG: aminopeptidase N, partial [Amphiplicatus sp.]